MKQNAELQRVSYSLQKHHRQLLHQQIDPKLIETLELTQNPSLNYRKAFESVYHDELQRTLQSQKEKEKKFCLPKIGHSSSHQSIQNRSYNPNFRDYDQERHRKFDDLINRGINEGHSFFRAQDEYQRRKQVEKTLATHTLKQQLVINRDMRTLSKQKQNQEAEVLRLNRARQLQLQNQRQAQRKQEQLSLGAEVQQQMHAQHLKKARKSYFQLSNIARHNPITNPIEYHIDNPYILKKIQDKVVN